MPRDFQSAATTQRVCPPGPGRSARPAPRVRRPARPASSRLPEARGGPRTPCRGTGARRRRRRVRATSGRSRGSAWRIVDTCPSVSSRPPTPRRGRPESGRDSVSPRQSTAAVRRVKRTVSPRARAACARTGTLLRLSSFDYGRRGGARSRGLEKWPVLSRTGGWPGAGVAVRAWGLSVDSGV